MGKRESARKRELVPRFWECAHSDHISHKVCVKSFAKVNIYKSINLFLTLKVVRIS